MKIKLYPRNPELRRIELERARNPQLQFIKTGGEDLRTARAVTNNKTGSSAGVFQPLDAELTAIAGLTSAADKVPYFTGSGTAAVTTLTSFGRSLIDDANAAAALATIGAADSTAHYLTSQAESGLSAEVNLGALTTGLLKHTVAAGVSTPATAVAGTDYYNPGGTDVAIADGGTGQSTAAAAINALGAAPAPGIFPTVLPKNGSTNTALASGTSVCAYLGKAPVTASSWKVAMYQGTAGAAPTSWAEVALCSGGAPVAASNQSLTTAGYVDISSWIGGAGGPRLLTISASFTAGDHMWLVIGENTTTRANVRSCVADEMDSGQIGSASARPSTMGAGTAFTKSTTLAGPFAYVYPN